MLKRLRQIVIITFLSVIPVIIIPQFYDPLELHRWTDVAVALNSLECYDDNCLLVVHPPGTVTYPADWQATTTENRFRETPNQTPDCETRIATVGDSYTWGLHVSDHETWTAELARRFPDTCFFNYGVPGYNAEQVAATVEQRLGEDIDHALYFVFWNDMTEPIGPGPTSSPSPLIFSRYARFLSAIFGLRDDPAFSTPAQDADAFRDAIDRLGADGRVQFIGYEDELLLGLIREQGYDTFGISLTPDHEQTSVADEHPAPAGHARMASEMAPLVESLLDR